MEVAGSTWETKGLLISSRFTETIWKPSAPSPITATSWGSGTICGSRWAQITTTLDVNIPRNELETFLLTVDEAVELAEEARPPTATPPPRRSHARQGGSRGQGAVGG